MKGYTIHVGFFDENNQDAQGNGTKRVEIRIYNADGIPAERIQVPFRDVSWTDG